MFLKTHFSILSLFEMIYTYFVNNTDCVYGYSLVKVNFTKMSIWVIVRKDPYLTFSNVSNSPVPYSKDAFYSWACISRSEMLTIYFIIAQMLYHLQYGQEIEKVFTFFYRFLFRVMFTPGLYSLCWAFLYLV